jgi:hypothetical protein
MPVRIDFVAWSWLVALRREKPVKIGAKAPFPGFVAPALAKGTRCIHEIKFDGYGWVSLRATHSCVLRAIKVWNDTGRQPRFTFEIGKNWPSDVQPLFDHHLSERDRRKAMPTPGSKQVWAACSPRVE